MKPKEIWYAYYPCFISAILTIMCLLGLTTNDALSLLTSQNASSAFGAVITFSSIIIGFIGVLLTAIVSIKRESELIKYFLEKADKETFSNLISRNILSGIGVALVSVILFFCDKACIILERRGFGDFTIHIIFCVWVFLLSYFVLSTYKLMHVLLTMLIRSDEKRPQVDDPDRLTQAESDALIDRHLHN